MERYDLSKFPSLKKKLRQNRQTRRFSVTQNKFTDARKDARFRHLSIGEIVL